MKNNKGRTFTIGDCHGNYKGLMQCLERCGFDNEKDTLISLGDVVDGHCQSFEVVEKLLSIKNLIAVKGNHDDWFYQWIVTGINPANWGQGQKATGESYLEKTKPGSSWVTLSDGFEGMKMHDITLKPQDIPLSHREFFKNQLPYYLDDDNNLFIHGGFNRHFHLDDQDESIFWWDRDLWSQALSWGHMSGMAKPGDSNWKPKFKMMQDFKEVFIGHTSTQFWKENEPMNAANIWNLDTGGGWYGRVSIMCVDTKQFWQSDDALTLYPDFKGR
jgi:serine/threonine protein phosphatase 1